MANSISILALYKIQGLVTRALDLVLTVEWMASDPFQSRKVSCSPQLRLEERWLLLPELLLSLELVSWTWDEVDWTSF